jgi:hypothetical protein
MAAQFFKRVEWILSEEGVTYDKQGCCRSYHKTLPDNRVFLMNYNVTVLVVQLSKGILPSVTNMQLR